MSTLTTLFSDIADAIRSKTGGSNDILPSNFSTEIAAIPTVLNTTTIKAGINNTSTEVSILYPNPTADYLCGGKLKVDDNRKSNKLCYGNGKYVFCDGGASYQRWYSTDLQTWTAASYDYSGGEYAKNWFLHDRFFRAGQTSQYINYSLNGTSWSRSTLSTAQYIRSMVYVENYNQFCAWTLNGPMLSTDGVNWGTPITVSLPTTYYQLKTFVYNNQTYILGISQVSTASIICSLDGGTTWTSISTQSEICNGIDIIIQGDYIYLFTQTNILYKEINDCCSSTAWNIITNPLTSNIVDVASNNNTDSSTIIFIGQTQIAHFQLDNIQVVFTCPSTWTASSLGEGPLYNISYVNNCFFVSTHTSSGAYYDLFLDSQTGLTWKLPFDNRQQTIDSRNSSYCGMVEIQGSNKILMGREYYYNDIWCSKNITDNLGPTSQWHNTASLGALSLSYGNNTFVIGRANGAMRSSNGIDWVSTNAYGRTVGYGNDFFVCIDPYGTSSSNSCYYSSNGATWTSSTLSENVLKGKICFNDTHCLIFDNSSQNYIIQSTDGATWSTKGTFNISQSYSSLEVVKVCYGNGHYVAIVKIDSTPYLYETDTINYYDNWTQVARIYFSYYDLAYGNNRFTLITTYPMYKIDGESSWTYGTSICNQNCFGVNYINNKFYASFANGTLMTSPDCITWSQEPITTYPIYG